MLTLGLYVRPWLKVPYPDVPAVGRFESTYYRAENWKPDYPNPAFRNARPDDRFWAARIVAAVNDEAVAAVVRTAKFTDPRATEYLTKTLLERRTKVLTAWLNGTNPVVDLALSETGELTFANAATRAAVAKPAEKYTVPLGALRQRHRDGSSGRRRADRPRAEGRGAGGAAGGEAGLHLRRAARVPSRPPGVVTAAVGVLPQDRRPVDARRPRPDSVIARGLPAVARSAKAGLLAAAVLAALAALFAFKAAAKMPDFEVYWRAGVRALRRRAALPRRRRALPAQVPAGVCGARIPAGLLPLTASKAAWFTVSVGLIPILIALSLSLLPVRRRPAWLLAGLTFVLMAKFYGHELVLGQVNLFFAC